MIAIVTVLFALPLGLTIRSHLAANVTYALAYLWAFTFQGIYLTRSWVGGDDSAFPKSSDTLPLSYAIVSGAIFALGFVLVWVGHRTRSRRAHRVTAGA